MTPRSGDLAARLAARIRRDGPISVADYMACALTDPQDGYYTRQDPLGAAISRQRRKSARCSAR